MKTRGHWRWPRLIAAVAAAALILAAACSSPRPSTTHPPTSTATAPATRSALTPTDIWLELFQRTPYPFTTPLPPPTSTALDGSYVKLELKEGTPVPCRRCPDYLPEGGLWKLNLDKGIFRIAYEVTGWRSLGSFAVSENLLILFNDPNCIDETGVYSWTLADSKLTLEVVEDTCAIGLRAGNLTSLPWLSCQPPTVEASSSDHWPQPSGC